MEGGDLANTLIPRFLFCWEHLAADLSHKAQTHEHVLVKWHRWAKAVQQWDLNPMFSVQVWDLWSRYNMRCDVVVTTRPQEFANEVAVVFDTEDIPVHRVISMEHHVLVRRMGNRPDVARIFYGDPSLQFTFGPKGVFVANGLHDFHPMSS